MTTFIDENRKFAFVDVPMTAGVQVCSLFFRSRDDAAFLEASPMNSKFAIHDTIERIYEVVGQSLRDYYTFALVRNTYDWLLARYQHTLRSSAHPDHQRCAGMSFEDYVLQEGVDAKVRLQKRHVHCNDIRVTHIASCASFHETVQELASELELELKRPVADPDGVSLDYRASYNDRMIAHVEKVYQEDLEFFAFRF